MKTPFTAGLCAGLLSLAACTTAPGVTQSDTDPLEGFNRTMFQLNYGLDVGIVRPITAGYRYVVPVYGRKMVNNFLENLYSPVVFANSVLQADPENSFSTLWRFIINSTIGIGGLYDVASEAGLHNRPADFGETLAFYGVDSGPYLYLPFVGPSDIRDGAGLAVDSYAFNPVNHASDNWVWVSDWAATVIDKRSENMNVIDNLYRDSIDPYTMFRSAYLQHRAADIKKGKAARDKALKRAAMQGHQCSMPENK